MFILYSTLKKNDSYILNTENTQKEKKKVTT